MPKKNQTKRKPSPAIQARLDAIAEKRTQAVVLSDAAWAADQELARDILLKAGIGVEELGVYDFGFHECPDERNGLASCVYNYEPEGEYADPDACLFCGDPKERK